MNRPRNSTATHCLGFALIFIAPLNSLAQDERIDPMPPARVLLESTEARATNDVASLSVVDPSVFAQARSIVSPGERSLALQRIGRTAVFCGQLKEAEAAFYEAGEAATLVSDRVMRDVRITSVITAILTLAEEQLRLSKDVPSQPVVIVDPTAPANEKPIAEALPANLDHYLDSAIAEWENAARLAMTIANSTYRSEALYKVVESQSREPLRPIGDTLSSFSDPKATMARPENDPKDLATSDHLLALAAGHAQQIDRAIWRNKALKTVVENAASSRQYRRALQVARLILQPDIRSEALIRLAEEQSLHGKQSDATSTFNEAAESVASIGAGDLRAIIANVLVDNLVTVGRFDDARACVTLYPFEWQQVAVLGAVAESQGRRGLSASAYRWIDRDIAPKYRGILYRRVADGVLPAVEQNRSKDLGSGKF